MKIYNGKHDVTTSWFSLMIFFGVFMLPQSAIAQVVAQKKLLNPLVYPEAICNDGTPGAFYLHLATKPDGSPAENWVIHFKGGATCNSEQSCIQRRIQEPEKTSSDDSLHPPTTNLANFGIFKVLRDALPDEPFKRSEDYLL